MVHHLEHAPCSRVERGLRDDLVPAAKAVLDQEVFVECPHLAEAGGGVQGERSVDRCLGCDVLGELNPFPEADRPILITYLAERLNRVAAIEQSLQGAAVAALRPLNPALRTGRCERDGIKRRTEAHDSLLIILGKK